MMLTALRSRHRHPALLGLETVDDGGQAPQVDVLVVSLEVEGTSRLFEFPQLARHAGIIRTFVLVRQTILVNFGRQPGRPNASPTPLHSQNPDTRHLKGCG